MPPAPNDQLILKAERKDSSKSGGGCWSDPTVAGCQSGTTNLFWLSQAPPPLVRKLLAAFQIAKCGNMGARML